MGVPALDQDKSEVANGAWRSGWGCGHQLPADRGQRLEATQQEQVKIRPRRPGSQRVLWRPSIQDTVDLIKESPGVEAQEAEAAEGHLDTREGNRQIGWP